MKVSNNNGKEDNSMKNMSGNGTMPPPPMGNISTPPPPMGFSKIENGISQATINNNTNEVKSICLQKGQKINLTKDNPGLTKVMIGLGWDVNKYDEVNDISEEELDEISEKMFENGFVL